MNFKRQLSKQLAGNYKLDRQMMALKRSWDEVSALLNTKPAKKEKKSHLRKKS